MTTTTSNRERVMIPIGQLVRSPLNARKTAPTEGIEELAAMIASQDLLQNLTVVDATGTKRGKAKEAAAYEVVAGGRRLAALQYLVKQKTLPATHEALCLLVTAEDAVELSLAENSGREAMHPADQFEAFRVLVDVSPPASASRR